MKDEEMGYRKNYSKELIQLLENDNKKIIKEMSNPLKVIFLTADDLYQMINVLQRAVIYLLEKEK